MDPVEEAPETTETTEPEAQPDAPPERDLTDLIFSDDEKDRPVALRALDTALENEGVKAWSVKPDALAGMPIEAQQAVHNMERAFKTKAREVAEERKSLAAQRQEVEDLRLRAEQERAAALKPLLALAAKFEVPTGEPPDPFTDEGMQYRVRAAVADAMAPFFQELAKTSEEDGRLIEEKVEEARMARERTELQAHITSNPEEWAEIKDVVKLYVKGEGMHWKDAVEKARGLRGRFAPPAPPPPDPDAARVARRNATGAMRAGPATAPTVHVDTNLSYKGRRP